jgi:hypothetical protein
MSLISCDEIKEGRSGQLNYDWGRQYVRQFRCVTGDDRDGVLVATSTNAIPTIGVPYVTETESDPWALVRTVTGRQDEQDARLWIITVTYDTKFDSGRFGGSGGEPGAGGASGPQNRPPNPLNAPVRWRSSTVRASKFALADKDGKAFINSAGAPFSPPPELYKPLLQITATKNYASFPVGLQTAYFDKVNQTTWMGFPSDSVKVDGIEINEEFFNNTGYLSVNWTFLYDPEKWIPYKVLDKGWYYIDANGKKQPFKDDLGNQYEGLLDAIGGNGGALARFLQFRNHDRISFASIP